jgi:hypothetical protein
LLIGFNRPHLLQERLNEFASLLDTEVTTYVSIDGPRAGNTGDESAINQIKTYLAEFSATKSLVTWISSTNKGCDVHIFDSITKVLQENEYVIVIEDDIVISSSAIIEIMAMSEKIAKNNQINPIVAMSGISRRVNLLRNKWRYSKYFSAWGFAISKEFWNSHMQNMEIKDSFKVAEKLSNSEHWLKLSDRKKRIWSERINRGNYDYAIQRTIFFNDLKTMAPLFRISDNVGHGSQGASHTRFKTPRFLRFPVVYRNDNFNRNIIQSDLLTTVFTWLDSQTWAGDGFLSVRGRTRGFRTFIKGILFK